MKKSWLVPSMGFAVACEVLAILSGQQRATAADELHATGQSRTITLAPCDVPGVRQKARCGTFEVWENRDAHTGRRISLKVLVLPATGSPVAPDALTFFGGGPGQAATELAPSLAAEFAALRQHRDLLLVDQRGTGGSHALNCDLYAGGDRQAALGAFYPVDRVRACRAALEKDADLGRYTTASSVDDVDDVRAAIGYEQLDLLGGSYGTRAALVYLRRHPDHSRVAVLQGVVPTGERMPLDFPQYAQRAIDAVFADCDADSACHAAFPNLRAELRAIVQRTSERPVPADIVDPTTGKPVHVALSRNLLGEALRYLMYGTSSALFVPDLVHQAASGDFAPLAEFALGSRLQLVNGLGQGLYLSITCAEDLPFITSAEAARAAANTFLGDYRYQQQRAACDAWVRGPVPAGFRDPARADTPVLMFSGSWDPVTPPGNAARAAASLPHSVSVVVNAGGHGYDGLPGAPQCVAAISNRFVERGSVDGLDTSCVSGLRRPPFPTRPVQTKPVTLSSAELAAFAGRYVGLGAPPLEITVSNGTLVARLEGREASLALVPVSPTRLRVAGSIGDYLEVQMDSGKAVRVTLEQAGTRTVTWNRQIK